jgi:hypothetical protein
MFKRLKKLIRRPLQRVTGVHLVHHNRYAYGYTLPFSTTWVYFIGWTVMSREWDPGSGWRRVPLTRHEPALRCVSPRDYHDCTKTGVY